MLRAAATYCYKVALRCAVKSENVCMPGCDSCTWHSDKGWLWVCASVASATATVSWDLKLVQAQPVGAIVGVEPWDRALHVLSHVHHHPDIRGRQLALETLVIKPVMLR